MRCHLILRWPGALPEIGPDGQSRTDLMARRNGARPEGLALRKERESVFNPAHGLKVFRAK